MPSTAPDRLWWIDHLRTFAILLVVNLHACVTYSHVGDWYVKSALEPTLAQKVPYILWEAHLQSFFMGLLFFISGYFAHHSIARHGPRRFARERLMRLGLPALLYMLVIHPFIVRGLNPWNAKFPPAGTYYRNYLESGRFLSSSGPLWFVVALLIFSFVVAAARATRRSPASEDNRQAAEASPRKPPSAATLWALAAVLALVTFGVRLTFPIGASVLNLQLCFFAQYVAFFIGGLHAARHGWLTTLASSRRARIGGWLALGGGPLLLLGVIWAGSKNGAVPLFFGGWHWQALGFAIWEQLAGVGLSLGALALFSGKFNIDAPVGRWLAKRSFAVYVLHAPILVALFMAFRNLPQHRVPAIALLTASGWVLSFLAADLARRTPGLRSIL
jgi:glucan biosynthesis protein C